VDEGVDDSLSHLLPLIWELYKFSLKIKDSFLPQ
jgi:hypothetical protein